MNLRHMTWTACLLAVTGNAACQSAAQEIRFHGESVIRFATRDEGIQSLTRRDRFVNALSRFDLQSRMMTDRDVTVDDYLKVVAGHCQGWSDAELERLVPVVKTAAEKLRPFQLPLPATVRLVNTDGKEEGGAAYCRMNTIVLPDTKIARASDASLEQLLLHELFHVLSSHNPALRKRLYELIGFQVVEPIVLPEAWRERKITNPDAPLLDCVIRLEIDPQNRDEQQDDAQQDEASKNDLQNDAQRSIMAVPLLYAEPDRYDIERGGSFFSYLRFRLMQVERADGAWRPRLNDGEPILFDHRRLKSFHEQIGRNTGYIIHPDEILADNFVLLVTDQEKVPTPRLLAQMRELLDKFSKQDETPQRP